MGRREKEERTPPPFCTFRTGSPGATSTQRQHHGHHVEVPDGEGVGHWGAGQEQDVSQEGDGGAVHYPILEQGRVLGSGRDLN